MGQGGRTRWSSSRVQGEADGPVQGHGQGEDPTGGQTWGWSAFNALARAVVIASLCPEPGQPLAVHGTAVCGARAPRQRGSERGLSMTIISALFKPRGLKPQRTWGSVAVGLRCGDNVTSCVRADTYPRAQPCSLVPRAGTSRAPVTCPAASFGCACGEPGSPARLS